MFLFSGYFGDILYTGDFRYRPNMFDGFELPPIDVLYLDNTYCSPKCIFPSREDAIELILCKLDTCLVQCDRVILGLDNLGKEDLLVQIVKETHSKIFFKSNRKQILQILGLSNIIATDEAGSKIVVVPTNQISGSNISMWNKNKKTHAILATARYCGFNFKPFSKFPEIHVVEYSNHSSFAELKMFIKEVQPSAIVPIVGKHVKGIFGTDISDRADMGVFNEFLRHTPQIERPIPESVKRTMNTQEMHCARPAKKRKIARKQVNARHRYPTLGIRYIVSDDSETNSEPEAVHFKPKIPVPSELISEHSSTNSEHISEVTSESDSEWEIVHSTGNGLPCVSLL